MKIFIPIFSAFCLVKTMPAQIQNSCGNFLRTDITHHMKDDLVPSSDHFFEFGFFEWNISYLNCLKLDSITIIKKNDYDTLNNYRKTFCFNERGQLSAIFIQDNKLNKKRTETAKFYYKDERISNFRYISDFVTDSILYTYDADGKLITVKKLNQTGSRPIQHNYKFQYNNGRLIASLSSDNKTIFEYIYRKKYPEALISRKNGISDTLLKAEYDSAGRLKTVKGATQEKWVNSYSKLGLLQSTTLSLPGVYYKYEYSYDQKKRVSSIIKKTRFEGGETIERFALKYYENK